MERIAPHDDLPRAAFPSWLLSLALHLAAIVLLALSIRHPSAALVAGEKDRSVGVALARIDGDEVEYFDQEVEADLASSPRPFQAETEKTLSSELPDATALAKLNRSDLELPAALAQIVPEDTLIAEPKLSRDSKTRLPSDQGIADILAAEAAARANRRSLGPPAQVSLFGSAPAEGHSFLFVIDRSQSMGSQGLGVMSAAKAEFEAALAPLEPSHSFQILAYNHNRVYFGDKNLVPATDANKRLVGQFMRGLAAFGATNHFTAIMSALNRSPDVIFLLTDGGEPPLSAAQLATIHKKASGSTTIHCIQFGARPWNGDENYMQRLARQNGGSYRHVDMSRRPRHAVPRPDVDSK